MFVFQDRVFFKQSTLSQLFPGVTGPIDAAFLAKDYNIYLFKGEPVIFCFEYVYRYVSMLS